MHWRQEFSLGILERDDQHKTLIRSFGAIEEAIKQGQAWSTVYFSLADLREFARFHFTCEEALMRLHGFPDVPLHAAEHAHFCSVLAEVEKDHIRRPIEKGMIESLRMWLINHIAVSDRDFAQHILAGAAVSRS